MTLVQKFTEKYGINPIKLVEDANLKFFGRAKSMGLEKLLSEYVDTEDIIIVNNDFIKELVECFAEEKKKFPENLKATVDTGTKFEIPNQMSSIPKSKGTLENFKDIVGTDNLRPIMMGVYVSEDGFIVGTDAHKLVKQKNNGLLSQTDYAGKIIDLTKYIKSNGKLIDFVDGVFPKYDAVIPRESPYEDRQLSTYAFYNYAKSSLEVKRLLDSDVFNVNFNLMTDTSGGTKRFSFGYHVLLDALNFAMLNNWDFFTLRYSEPNRAVLFDFGGDNVILVMPMIDRYDSSAEGGSTGTIPLTTEEVEEKYRLGLKQQKSSKPAKAPKKATVSAPVSSEPFQKYTGELKDTEYIHRSKIASITLTNGEVLGKNDVIDGFYRVNKKMAQGGGVGEHKNTSYRGKIELKKGDKIKINTPHNKNLTITIIGRRGDGYDYISSSAQSQPSWQTSGWFDMMIQKPNAELIRYPHGGSMYADGGGISKGMASGDISFLQKNGYYFDGEFYFEADGEFIEVVQGTSPSNPRKVAVLFRTNEPITISRAMLDKISSSFGKDFHIELFTNAGVDLHSSANRKYKNISVERLPQSKMARGGSLEPRNPESFHKFYEDLTDLYFYAFELGNIEVDSDSIPINEKELKRLKIIISLLIKVSYGRIDLKMKTNFPEWVKDSMIIKPTLKEQLIEDDYKILADTIESKNLEKYAEGGSIEGLKVGSKVGFLRPRIGRYEWAEVLSIDGDNVNLVVRHPKRKQWDNYFTETKQRIEKYINTVDENWHDGRGRTTMKIKYEHGGTMYADGGNMFETPIAKYKEVSGKVVGSVPVSEEVYSSQVKDFVDYVYEVYEDYGFTKKQVKEAVDKYIKELGYQFTWGGGDSLDRERVYEYLRNPNLQGIKNPSFANGGSMSKSYEIGDIISFNSVMGGTKTGAIVSKLGEDGFRIKTEDGFATVKKSAIV